MKKIYALKVDGMMYRGHKSHGLGMTDPNPELNQRGDIRLFWTLSGARSTSKWLSNRGIATKIVEAKLKWVDSDENN